MIRGLPNPSLERSAQERRSSVPVARCAPAPAQLCRWASRDAWCGVDCVLWEFHVGPPRSTRPNTFEQLLVLPSVLGAFLFVESGLDVGGWRGFLGTMLVLFLIAPAYILLCRSSGTRDPSRSGQSRFLGAVFIVAFQFVFWAALFYAARLGRE